MGHHPLDCLSWPSLLIYILAMGWLLVALRLTIARQVQRNHPALHIHEDIIEVLELF